MMLIEKLNEYRIILASKSPRRQLLLREAGICFEVMESDTGEDFPDGLKSYKIPLYLSQKKADALNIDFDEKTLLITADTIVWINGRVINKPTDRDEAISMLKTLSGRMHEVFTGVTLRSKYKSKTFYVKSKVYFRKLKTDEIVYYVDTFKPFDKAGAYGIQEWIGYIAIRKIEGSFYNVMGLPITRLYDELERFIQH
ncbi:MAG: Septum formation protein Maf [Bacteroidetes bacterium ADurb.Bin408]|nr:MAG: Septum formation protein Maf [Bacteroidetes bacterium ADurb.Bin408]